MRIQEAITIVGRKRFVFVAVLLLICVALGYFWQSILIPQQSRLQGEKMGVDSELSRLRQEIIDLPAKYARMKAEEARYEALIAAGFNEEQDRIAARRIIDALRAKAGLNAVDYSIQPAKKAEHPDAYLLYNEEIVASGFEVSARGLTDLDFRRFMADLARHFRGLLVLKELSIERVEKLSPDTLARLGKGETVDLVEGKAVFEWVNIVPRTTEADPHAAAFGGGM